MASRLLFTLAAAGLVLSLVVLAFDLATPLGVPGGVPYVALGLFAIWVGVLLTATYRRKLAMPYGIGWRAVSKYQPVVALMVIMAALAITIAATSMGLLYATALDDQRARLSQVARSQALLIAALARHDNLQENQAGNGDVALADSLARIRDAPMRYTGLGKTGEIVLARRDGGRIAFLLGHGAPERPGQVAMDSALAEPMRRALAGRSGTLSGLDYRGRMVLAAHEPVAIFKLGVVAKIDLAEIRAPFFKAGILLAIVACLGVAVGTALFLLVSNPIIRQLLAAKERAEISDRSKTEFLANISHELRTPLNSVIGFSEMLHGEMLGKLGNAKYVEYAKYINDSGIHLLGVIEDILDVSKIETGEQSLLEKAVDIREAIRSSVAMLDQRLQEARIALSVDVPDDLPALYADPTRIKQIILNLASNAVKFTPPEGRISIRASLDHQNALLIHIQDSGIGIAAENLEKILHPFVQVENVLTRSHEGAGLGLPLAKSFMELHGGTFSIESKIGEGTTVTCRFPPQRTLGEAD